MIVPHDANALRLVGNMKVDYGATAELFLPSTKKRGAHGRSLAYRRFATAAEAIRFAMEDLPVMRSVGPWMQVGDAHFNTEAIRKLYESSDYPLRRRKMVPSRSRRGR